MNIKPRHLTDTNTTTSSRAAKMLSGFILIKQRSAQIHSCLIKTKNGAKALKREWKKALNSAKDAFIIANVLNRKCI